MTIADFLFNDEFFLHESDRQSARNRYPKIWFALHSDRVSSEFQKFDAQTKIAKMRLQNWGLAVVAISAIALILAALELTGVVPEALAKAVAGVAAVIGIAATGFALFGIYGTNKKYEWLQLRLLCERIRQWRWQYFCSHASNIVEASENGGLRKAYVEKYERDFDAIVKEYSRNIVGNLDMLIQSEQDSDEHMWLDMEFERAIDSIDSSLKGNPVFEELRDAYLRIRIGAQARYGQYIVSLRGNWRTHPGTQKALFENIGFACLAAIVLAHVSVLIGAFADVPALKSPIVHFSVVFFAIVALATRVLEGGFIPNEHLGRYKGYLSQTLAIARTMAKKDDVDSFKRSITEMESAAFDEMVDFLKSSVETKFVI